MNIDFTQLILAILGILFSILGTLITTKLIPFINGNFTTKQVNLIKTIIQQLVFAAEQVYDKADGEKKKQYVLECAQKELDLRGIKIDVDVLSAYIEGEVFNLKRFID